MINPTATTGVRDPDDPGRWLVLPWSAEADFCEVVRHFLTSSILPLFDDTNPARQLAYFEGYHVALLAASTDNLRDRLAWKWRDELLGCVADCVAGYRAQIRQPPADGNIWELPVATSTAGTPEQAS